MKSQFLEKLDRGSSGGVARLGLRVGAIQWLILCGAALVVAIMLGTAYLVLQFRDRALEAAEREMANSAQLLARHFDQQLTDLQRIHEDVVDYVRDQGIDS